MGDKAEMKVLKTLREIVEEGKDKFVATTAAIKDDDQQIKKITEATNKLEASIEEREKYVGRLKNQIGATFFNEFCLSGQRTLEDDLARARQANALNLKINIATLKEEAKQVQQGFKEAWTRRQVRYEWMPATSGRNTARHSVNANSVKHSNVAAQLNGSIRAMRRFKLATSRRSKLQLIRFALFMKEYKESQTLLKSVLSDIAKMRDELRSLNEQKQSILLSLPKLQEKIAEKMEKLSVRSEDIDLLPELNREPDIIQSIDIIENDVTKAKPMDDDNLASKSNRSIKIIEDITLDNMTTFDLVQSLRIKDTASSQMANCQQNVPPVDEEKDFDAIEVDNVDLCSLDEEDSTMDKPSIENQSNMTLSQDSKSKHLETIDVDVPMDEAASSKNILNHNEDVGMEIPLDIEPAVAETSSNVVSQVQTQNSPLTGKMTLLNTQTQSVATGQTVTVLESQDFSLEKVKKSAPLSKKELMNLLNFADLATTQSSDESMQHYSDLLNINASLPNSPKNNNSGTEEDFSGTATPTENVTGGAMNFFNSMQQDDPPSTNETTSTFKFTFNNPKKSEKGKFFNFFN